MNRRSVRRRETRFAAAVLALLLLGAGAMVAQRALAQDEAAPVWTQAELERLVGPVALYPDEILAVVLPASTYPLQIVQAARFLEDREANPGLEPDEDWDSSIVALLNYPEVLELLNEDLDWTWSLGEAVLANEAAVFDAVQAFREQARAAGNLATDSRQVVSEANGVIEIEPADPEVVYIPYYEPERVIVYQPVPVYHYYDYGYPLYYYPYPVGYSFRSGFFWGVTSAFSIGWHTHHLHVYDHHHVHHPYYRRSYYSPYYVRRNPVVNVTVNNVNNVWRPSRPPGARPGNRYRAQTNVVEGRVDGGPTREGNRYRRADEGSSARRTNQPVRSATGAGATIDRRSTAPAQAGGTPRRNQSQQGSVDARSPSAESNAGAASRRYRPAEGTAPRARTGNEGAGNNLAAGSADRSRSIQGAQSRRQLPNAGAVQQGASQRARPAAPANRGTQQARPVTPSAPRAAPRRAAPAPSAEARARAPAPVRSAPSARAPTAQSSGGRSLGRVAQPSRNAAPARPSGNAQAGARSAPRQSVPQPRQSVAQPRQSVPQPRQSAPQPRRNAQAPSGSRSSPNVRGNPRTR